MRTLQQMLRELARPEVAEFAVVSDRLPCIKVGEKYEPIDDTTTSTDAILELLVAIGGSRYVEDLHQKAAHWLTRVEGVGAIEVHAMMRGGRVQARLLPTARAGQGHRGAAAPVVPAVPVVAPVEAIPQGAEDVSDPMLRAALFVPGRAPGAPESTRSPFAGGEAAERGPSARSGTHPWEAPNASLPPSSAKMRAAEPVSVAPSSAKMRAAEPASVAPSSARMRAAQAAASRAAPARSTELARGWLTLARQAGASDLHVIAGRPLLLRVAGELVPSGEPIAGDRVEVGILPIVAGRLRSALDEHGSCDFAHEEPGLGRFRVNVTRQRTGLKACFRCVAPGIPTLASLGLPAEIERATHHHQGLVLVTGPTGHGKTSTLAAIVDIINRQTTHHVITVEDPVEYVHPRKRAMISQREVGSHTRSFAAALKGSLREDPDVIVVGELRDTETVRMALAASETGHLVIGTMNTPSAAKTIDRVIDLFPPADQAQVRMTLAGGLHLVVGQRLLPSADGRRMVVAAELLPGSVALWSLIRDGKTFQIPSLQQRGKGFGILRLDEALAERVKSGEVARETAMAHAENPDELEALLTGRPKGSPAAAPAPEPAKKPDASSLLGKAGNIFGKRGA